MGIEMKLQDVQHANVTTIHYAKNIILTNGATSFIFVQKMKENLYIDKLKGRITEHEYDNFFKKFEEEQQNINHRLQKPQDADDDYYITSAQIISLTSQAYDLFKNSEVN